MNPRGIFKERDPSKGGGGDEKEREKKNFVIAISIHLINCLPRPISKENGCACIRSTMHIKEKHLIFYVAN